MPHEFILPVAKREPGKKTIKIRVVLEARETAGISLAYVALSVSPEIYALLVVVLPFLWIDVVAVRFGEQGVVALY